jgi:hypothetical protein
MRAAILRWEARIAAIASIVTGEPFVSVCLTRGLLHVGQRRSQSCSTGECLGGEVHRTGFDGDSGVPSRHRSPARRHPVTWVAVPAASCANAAPLSYAALMTAVDTSAKTLAVASRATRPVFLRLTSPSYTRIRFASGSVRLRRPIYASFTSQPPATPHSPPSVYRAAARRGVGVSLPSRP